MFERSEMKDKKGKGELLYDKEVTQNMYLLHNKLKERRELQ